AVVTLVCDLGRARAAARAARPRPLVQLRGRLGLPRRWARPRRGARLRRRRRRLSAARQPRPGGPRPDPPLTLTQRHPPPPPVECSFLAESSLPDGAGTAHPAGRAERPR